jgi:hypothetical protein
MIAVTLESDSFKDKLKAYKGESSMQVHFTI